MAIQGTCPGCDKVRLLYKNKKTGEVRCRSCSREKEKCPDCGKIRHLHVSTSDGIKRCTGCAHGPKAGECQNCRQWKTVWRDRKTKMVICRPCRAGKHPCEGCNNLRSLTLDKGTGKQLCRTCRDALVPKTKCPGCGTRQRCTYRIKGNSRQRFCRSCKNKSKRKRICTGCGERRVLLYNGSFGRICDTCYKHSGNIVRCAVCTKLRHVAFRRDNGDPLCVTCYSRHEAPRAKCGICSHERPVAMNTELYGEICGPCYKRVKRMELKALLQDQSRVAPEQKAVA